MTSTRLSIIEHLMTHGMCHIADTAESVNTGNLMIKVAKRFTIILHSTSICCISALQRVSVKTYRKSWSQITCYDTIMCYLCVSSWQYWNDALVNRIVMLMFLRHQINDFDRLLIITVTVTYCPVLKRFLTESAYKSLQNRTMCHGNLYY